VSSIFATYFVNLKDKIANSKEYFIYDLTQTITNYFGLCILLGSLDIKLKYRRSALGPWWITISMLIFVTALGYVYSKVLRQPVSDMIPFLSTGFTLWLFISISINEGATILSDSQTYIRQIKMPFSIHVFRLIYRNVITMLHNLVVYILVVALFKIPVNWHTFLAIPGLILIIFNLYPTILLLGMIGARYRDMPQVIINLMQLLFFISPITWMPHLLSSNSKVLLYNPISYALDLVRSPMLGNSPEPKSWFFGIISFVFMTVLAKYFMDKYYKQISFWI
jgi:lipopolysaccharide transport system permease protein